jgi:hypothetical protein
MDVAEKGRESVMAAKKKTPEEKDADISTQRPYRISLAPERKNKTGAMLP